MNALAVDLAVTKLTVAAKNGNNTVTASYDIGMKQSETLVPAIEYVLEKAGLEKSELNFLAITKGPGSFTGLRLAFAALKAIELAFNIPLYGISTLDCYAEPYKQLPFVLVSVMDAKKDKFYAKIFDAEKTILEEGDYEPETIVSEINKMPGDKPVLFCGSDAELFYSTQKSNISKNSTFLPFSMIPTDSLFSIAEKLFEQKNTGLNDYDGPVYLRASEAEEKITK